MRFDVEILKESRQLFDPIKWPKVCRKVYKGNFNAPYTKSGML